MQFKKTLLATSVVASFGTGMMATDVAFGSIAAGSYDLTVLTTPIYTSAKGKTSFSFGSDGAWASSFTFGGGVPSASSQGMTDNALKLVRPDSTLFGSGVVDTYAGKLGITVDGSGTIAVTSFSKDTIFGTAGGNFAQEVDAIEMGALTGSIDGANNLTLVTGNFVAGIGREGAIDSGAAGNPCGPLFCDVNWNKDDVGLFQEYATFRTTSASTDLNTVNGAVLTSIGDVNLDGLLDYKAILVSGGDVGTAWGPGFAGQDYFEIWSIQLLSKASDPVVPVPAAVWLFGSGLLGLVGVARRKAK